MSAPTIETERLRLRPWRDDDVERFVTMHADPRVMEFYPSTYAEEYSRGIAARLRKMLDDDGYGCWIAEIKQTAGFAGILVLQRVPFEAPFTPAHEVGWRLVPQAWGHGYATEGARALLDFGFTKLGLEEIVAMTSVPNVRSQRVMERLGMTRDHADDFENPCVAQGHRLRAHVLYRIKPAA